MDVAGALDTRSWGRRSGNEGVREVGVETEVAHVHDPHDLSPDEKRQKIIRPVPWYGGSSTQ
jgi:hypothetical protein